MKTPVNKNKLLIKLVKLQRQKEAGMIKLSELHSKEMELTNWLTCLEENSFCHGDRVYSENDIRHPPSPDGSDRQATVCYTRRTVSDQTLVVLTTANEYCKYRT